MTSSRVPACRWFKDQRAPDLIAPTAALAPCFAPGRDFVLYYDDDAPYFDGIVRIGEFDGDKEAIERLPETASVTIERAR